ncbi:MAG: glycoside hydrolase family 3 N-terminal domain-containing protein [Candidatus Nanopelagicales bacterium]
MIIPAIIAGSLIGASLFGAPPAVDQHVPARVLAADVLFACADMTDAASLRSLSRQGVAGIVLLGSRAPRGLRRDLRAARRLAPAGHAPTFASDEEGGSVQRLGALLGDLPSAESMGSWSTGRLRRTAARYARGMSRLGVDMSLAPVADLRVPGSFLTQYHRTFAAAPSRVGRDVVAWSRGTAQAGVTPVVKHWPGHGHARDTHTSAARVPSFRKLRKSDLRPFRTAFDAGVQAVLVAHVKSRGLTRGGAPASQSPRALRVLRAQAGPEAVIITDSLSMAAASSARGLSEPAATIAALRAGADWAMVCTPRMGRVIDRVARAIRTGDLDRARVEHSAERIRALTP